MEEKEMITVPYVALESERARCERMLKDELDRHQKERHDERLKAFIIIIVLILLLFGTNAGWLAYESQYVDEVTETIETSADGGGNAYGTIISGDNSGVNYGESKNNPDKAEN